MASHLSWFVKLLFLLLMLARAPTIDTRPASATPPTVDLIAGNEFLKLLFERDETQRELHSGERDASERVVRGVEARSSSSGSSDRGAAGERRMTRADHYQSTGEATTHSSDLGNRGAAARSLSYKSRNVQNEATATTTPKPPAEEGKQVVKLVTSGSKIVFLEEYDDNDAIVDAEARDIDLKKEVTHTASKSSTKSAAGQQVHMPRKSNPSDEVKVVAVSVSSSSKRGGHSRTSNQYHTADTDMSKQSNKFPETRASMPHTDVMRQSYKQTSHDNNADRNHSVANKSTVTATLTTTAAPSVPMTASATSTMEDFVNRSHKSEFSIEEAEPLTMSPQKLRGLPHSAARINSPRSLHTPHAVSGRAVKMPTNLDAVDSENSASTNIQNVLAAPLAQSVSARTATVTAPAAYQSANNKRNGTSSPINHGIANAARSHVNTQISGDDDMSDTVMRDTSAAVAHDVADDTDVDEKLLPFQTVIYHNTKEGHGPQSRSISYSSLSQNVEDLHAWRHSGILAEAQRNVSESLKPLQRAQLAHNSEPAKFYSVPSKMYSEPSKFYSEPAKVYSEPAKVYGEPEQFYSEPAKVYGQPSKFYSEPAKVYSQPAKVYGEPAKTYWSPSAAGTAVTTSTSTPSATSSSTTSSATTARPGRYMPSRRPAIVSRIAFGEAQTTTAASTQLADEHPPSVTMSVPTNQQHEQQQHHTHHTRFHPHAHAHSHSHGAHSSHGAHDSHSSVHEHTHTHAITNSQSHVETAAPPAQSQSQSQSHSAQSQPRRVLFNLDKLPYDLLNAPQSPQHLLDPDFSHSPPAAVTYSSPRQRQCLESAFSASLSQSALQQQQQQQRQYSSLSDQHSNQNAKGLPNRDLVKCVSKYNQPLATSTATTESSHNGDDDDDDNNKDDGGDGGDGLYTPTPEQNYEIEESVSVMTNGRAHGTQGNAAVTTTARPKFPSRGAIHHQQHQQQQQQLQHHYRGNANTNANIDNNYDDGVANVGSLDGGSDDDGIAGDGSKTGNGNGNGDDDDDAKVAYVVEGRNYRKYRVEEKTDDGFIVGEYGVVDHNDGNLRGVRYTADSTINRSLIQKALLTFLKLK